MRARARRISIGCRSNVRAFECHVNDYSDYYTQLAIQGPKAAETLAKLTNVDLSTIKVYWFKWGTVCGLANTLIARTGYTGEDGFEIYVPADVATSERVWNEVLEAGGSSASCRAGWARAIRCGWKRRCRSMSTKFPRRLTSLRLIWIAS